MLFKVQTCVLLVYFHRIVLFHPVSKVSPVVSRFPGVCSLEEVWADGSV